MPDSTPASPAAEDAEMKSEHHAEVTGDAAQAGTTLPEEVPPAVIADAEPSAAKSEVEGEAKSPAKGVGASSRPTVVGNRLRQVLQQRGTLPSGAPGTDAKGQEVVRWLLDNLRHEEAVLQLEQKLLPNWEQKGMGGTTAAKMGEALNCALGALSGDTEPAVESEAKGLGESSPRKRSGSAAGEPTSPKRASGRESKGVVPFKAHASPATTPAKEGKAEKLGGGDVQRVLLKQEMGEEEH
ncbi:hypothetical protein T484DRAFT_1842923, partial [Baffinella frigidus]